MKKTISIITALYIFCVFSTSIGQTSLQKKSINPTIIDSLHLKSVEGNPRTSEGDFIVLGKNKILTVYTKFTGVGDADRASLIGRISRDNGSTWGEEIIMVENEGFQNVMSVSLLKMKKGRLGLFYLVKNSNSDCYPVFRISNDEGKTWSESKRIIPPGRGYFVLNNNRVVRLKSGRILIPVANHKYENSVFQQDAKINCWYSDNDGKTWQESEEVNGPEGVIKQEPGLVELSDGRVLMYLRTDSGFQYFSHSSDNGQTWTQADKGTLISARSPALIVRDPYTKALLAIWNDDATNRVPLSIAVSFDEAATWHQQQTFGGDPSLWYCYPALEVVAPNTMLVSFCFGEKRLWGLQGMKIYKFKYDYTQKK